MLELKVNSVRINPKLTVLESITSSTKPNKLNEKSPPPHTHTHSLTVTQAWTDLLDHHWTWHGSACQGTSQGQGCSPSSSSPCPCRVHPVHHKVNENKGAGRVYRKDVVVSSMSFLYTCVLSALHSTMHWMIKHNEDCCNFQCQWQYY